MLYLIVAVVFAVLGAAGGVFVYRRKAQEAEAMLSEAKSARDKALTEAVALRNRLGSKG